MKSKVNLARAVERFREATKAVKDEVEKLKQEKPPPVERGTGEGAEGESTQPGT